MASVIGALDATFRALGGVPTYVLTDNERTVTQGRIANVAIRNQVMVDASLYYGFTLATCVPYYPESKGCSESTVKIAKADIVPKETDLHGDYRSFAELQEACATTMAHFNTRLHAVTKKTPTELLAQVVNALHSVPVEPYVGAFGTTRSVSWSSTISYLGARYSVPNIYSNTKAWVRVVGGELVISTTQHQDSSTSGDITMEIARHRLLEPGGASICYEHYPPRPTSPTDRPPKATSAAEAAFLAIGHGAARWLIEAGAVGTRSISAKMVEAVELVGIYGAPIVDEALSTAAMVGRLCSRDLLSILQSRPSATPTGTSEGTLQAGTDVWEGFGR